MFCFHSRNASTLDAVHQPIHVSLKWHLSSLAMAQHDNDVAVSTGACHAMSRSCVLSCIIICMMSCAIISCHVILDMHDVMCLSNVIISYHAIISCVVHIMCCYVVIVHACVHIMFRSCHVLLFCDHAYTCMHVSFFFRHSREQARSRRHAAFSRETFGACDGGARRWQ